MPEWIDAADLLEKAIEYKVAFVPGMAFHPSNATDGHNTCRLNFSNATPEMIAEGIKRLGMVLTMAIDLHKAEELIMA